MNKVKRKFRKLLRDPKLFFSDMYFKHSIKIKKHLPVKYEGKHQFTIVSAVYNVEKYLDDFFDSIVKQNLSFKKHIQIILVDDGSKDSSANIIKKWQKKYPNNIHYYYKENGGQASARNLGLKYVQTEWVTFIDPDDFLSLNYFLEVDKKLSEHKNIAMIVCNLLFFMEKKEIITDKHPLKFRFEKDVNCLSIKDLNNNLNLSVATSFFRTSVIQGNQLLFDNRVKPNFEDGKFISDYLFELQHYNALFLKKPVYFYRKREDGTSTLDTSWQKPEKYKNVLEYGFIPMLQKYHNKLSYVPNNIQKTALYDMYWYIQYLLNRPEKIRFLSEKDQAKFYQLYDKVFEYIDVENIMQFNSAGAWFFHKVGMIGAFKNQRPPFQIAYIENIDREKKQILISYFTYFDDCNSFRLNGRDTLPVYQKTVTNTFNEKLFTYEKRSWIPFEKEDDILTISLNGLMMRISVKGTLFSKGISINKILSAFTPQAKYLTDGSWLLMDRETKADDNAEHFYRYMQTHHPEQRCYFVLNKSSIDWQRLKKDKFNLVEFGSIEYERRLEKASKIISSHLEAHINNYFGDNYDFSKKFIFLQHGITKDDLSQWFNTKKNLSGVITATIPEYNSIVEELNKYKIGKKETFLTGFPRHDKLLSGNIKGAKTILIVPTWRHYIMGTQIGKGANTRELNKAFMTTNYAKAWYNLLHSQELKNLIKNLGYKVIFAPHPNIEPYLNEFNIPQYIDVWKSAISRESMQSLFQQSNLLITDYSSIAFEMAFLGKQTIYYQFDKEEFRSGIHTYQQGYFEYEKDGFGPVAETLDDLFIHLDKFVNGENDYINIYQSRIQKTFKYRDTNNCQRVYEAIINLDMPDKDINKNIILNALESAYKAQDWNLVISRAEALLAEIPNHSFAKSVLFEAVIASNNKEKMQVLLASPLLNQQEKAVLQATICSQKLAWQDVLNHLKGIILSNEQLLVLSLKANAYLHNAKGTQKTANKLSKIIDKNKKYLFKAWVAFANQDWISVISLLESKLSELSKKDLDLYLPELLLARAYCQLNDFTSSHNCLVAFERHSAAFPLSRIEIAHLAYARRNYTKCIDQLNKCFAKELDNLPAESLEEYALSLLKGNNTKEFEKLVESSLSEKFKDRTFFKKEYVSFLVKNQLWKKLVKYASNWALQDKEKFNYPLMLAHYRLGDIAYVYQNHIKPTEEHPYEYWELIAETALLYEDIDLSKYCYRGIISIFPNKNKQQNLSIFFEKFI
uniref:TagF-like capsule polymerase Cps1B n=1 Tax=Actinobacillus pleuropneumoniae serovar 1 str. 4074 TaxID=228399 RepID=A0A2S0ETM4_ACTPL|nr:TagF-like capsule polymerase Cps1B [Actinobacillus pleuropneumoniae serovar 1 str. 4074]